MAEIDSSRSWVTQELVEFYKEYAARPAAPRSRPPAPSRTSVGRISEEKLDQAASLRHPARRSLVERTLAWLQQCRASLIRYDKQLSSSLGLIQLACARRRYRRLHRARQVQAF